MEPKEKTPLHTFAGVTKPMYSRLPRLQLAQRSP
jgi:hypothetical protein